MSQDKINTNNKCQIHPKMFNNLFIHLQVPLLSKCANTRHDFYNEMKEQ